MALNPPILGANARTGVAVGRLSAGHVDDAVLLPARLGRLDDLLDGEAVLAAGVDLLSRHAGAHLLDPAGNPLVEGLAEAGHAAHDAVANYGQLHAAARIEGELLKAVFQHE